MTSCISVNLFWRHLGGGKGEGGEGVYAGHDLYGNKDLVRGDKGMRGLEKGIEELRGLPREYREFYLGLMRERIRRELEKEREGLF